MLNKLLVEKKQNFQKLIKTPQSEINFSLIEKYNEDDNLTYLF